MILDEITLFNFNAFRGEHRIPLAPRSKATPIVLFGGLNGAGKTSLLEALQLSLYGKLAKGLRQDGGGYEEYLEKSIHRDVPKRDGASVSVSFRSTVDGRQKSYCVRRSWSMPRQRIAEHLDVFVDGKRDELLSDSWAEQADQFIPARLCDLYFFDGERIEALADPGQSSHFLRTAIHALLGVDLARQLHDDLSVLCRRKTKEFAKGVDRVALESLERDVAELDASLVELKQENAALRNQRDRAAKQLRDLDRRFEESGGRLLEERRELESRRAKLQEALQSVATRLVDAAHGVLPLLLVNDLLRYIEDHARREHAARRHRALLGDLRARDDALLDHVSPILSKDQRAHVRTFLSEDRDRREQSIDVEEYLELSNEDIDRIGTLIGATGQREASLAQDLVRESDRVERCLTELDRKLAAIPDDDAVASLVQDRDAASRVLAELDHRLAAHDAQVRELETRLERRGNELDTVLRADRSAALENEDAERTLRHAKRVQETLGAFKTGVVEQNVEKLQQLVLECFRHLLRKTTLLADLKIDPNSCSIRALSSDGTSLDPQRFSAGERQLLAVSLLWGLGRASGRPLPVVVDTPLGRLDSAHRQNLVERYFPFASHQVLLLSTDEEIDEQHYESLRPKIGRSYRITYDDQTRASRVEEGYFW